MTLARTSRGIRLVLVGLLAVIAGAAASPVPALSSHQKAVFKARDKVFPALVHIEPVLDVFQSGRQRKQAVTGSGFIISPDGYVVTNNHVVQRARRVTCTLSTREEVEASVIGTDPLSDLAVIRIDPEALSGPLPAATLGDSDKLEIGEIVMAMGSPLGLARSVSLGVVSSLDRYIPESQLSAGVPTGRYNTWIQTDAAINPGNSGGPLVNLDGEVVGVNARAITVVGENLGFAIPIDLAKEVVAQLIDRGNIRRSWIGVSWQELHPLATFLGVSPERGAVVAHVESDSPAEGAGLKPGDVVLGIGESPMSARFQDDLPALEKIVADLPVDASLDLAFVRNGRLRTATILTRPQPDLEPEEAECRAWGFTVQEITDELVRNLQLQDRRGVIISGIRSESFAQDAGLQVGDVLRQLESNPIRSVNDFRERCEEMSGEKRAKILVQVRRGRVVNFHVMKPIYRDEDQPAVEASRQEAGAGGAR